MDTNKDFQYAFSWMRMCFRVVGLYPDPEADVNTAIRHYPWMFFGAPIVIFQLALPQIGTIIRHFGHPFLMPSAFITLSVASTAMSKLLVTWIHAEEIHMILCSILKDWQSPKTEEQRTEMLRFAKAARNSLAASVVTLIFTLTFHIMFHLLLVYQTRAEPIRYVLYPIIFPYDVQKTPYYELTITGQVFGGIFTGITNSTFDSLIANVSLHTSGQLIILRRVFENLAEEVAEKKEECRDFHARFSWAVKRHQHLMKLSHSQFAALDPITQGKFDLNVDLYDRIIETLNGCYSKVILLQLFGTVMQLCFLSLQVFFILGQTIDNTVVVRLIRLVVFVFVTITNLFIECYAAQRLCDESMNLRQGVYACKWYNLAPRPARPLILVMCRSLVPLQITVGDFAVLSLELFGTIVRTSMGYVSVFLSVMS